jgi:hypothetical protein
LANTRQYEEEQRTQQYRQKKARKRKILAFVVLFLLVFIAGMYVGHNHYPAIRQFFGGAVRAPLEGIQDLAGGASSSAWKEELAGAIDNCSDSELDPNRKKRLKKEVEDAFAVRDNYDGRYKAAVEQLWSDARKMYDEGMKDGALDGSELRNVVAKLNEAVEAAK